MKRDELREWMKMWGQMMSGPMGGPRRRGPAMPPWMNPLEGDGGPSPNAAWGDSRRFRPATNWEDANAWEGGRRFPASTNWEDANVWESGRRSPASTNWEDAGQWFSALAWQNAALTSMLMAQLWQDALSGGDEEDEEQLP